MKTFFGPMQAILTAFPLFAAFLLTGCGPGCGTLGVENTSPCSGTTSSAILNPTTPATSTFSISGSVSGPALVGVTINLTGAATGSTSTDVNGNYSFTALPTGSYTVAPSLAGFVFSPASSAVTISGANVSVNNFAETASAAASSSLSGTVSGSVVQNVLITLGGTNSGSALTDTLGNYSFSGLAAGSYTLTPALAGHTFTPASRALTTISGQTATGLNFTETAAP
jgi:hypothetical protein